jgi:hypothetical protein
MADSIRNNIRLTVLDQRLASLRKIGRAAECELVLVGLSGMDSSPISSRASQNAAALLFDLGEVDVR